MYTDEDYKTIDDMIINEQYDILIENLNDFRNSCLKLFTSKLLYRYSAVLINIHNRIKSMGEKFYYTVIDNYCSSNKEQIMSDINYCIFILAKRAHDNHKEKFIVYLTKCFSWEIVRLIIKELDWILKCKFKSPYDSDLLGSISNYKLSIEYNLDYMFGYLTEDNNFTYKWIKDRYKSTQSSIFDNLSKEEKIILIEWYWNKKTDTEISKQFSKCRGTINRNRLKIVDKLYIKALNHNLIVV